MSNTIIEKNISKHMIVRFAYELFPTAGKPTSKSPKAQCQDHFVLDPLSVSYKFDQQPYYLFDSLPYCCEI